jgi:hypothetical protein
MAASLRPTVTPGGTRHKAENALDASTPLITIYRDGDSFAYLKYFAWKDPKP